MSTSKDLTTDQCIAAIAMSTVPITPSTVIAEQCEISHQQVLSLIDDHLCGANADFGEVRFENQGGTRVAHLSVSQAGFIFLMLPNTPITTAFKASFIKSVFIAAEVPAKRLPRHVASPTPRTHPRRGNIVKSLIQKPHQP
jgi:phage regulator Rha-like protein